MSNYRLSLLGTIQIEQNGQPVDLTAVKAKALLSYLALTPGDQPRPLLAALLWADKPDKAALANLRMALSQIRKGLPDLLTVTRTTAALNREAVAALDVDLLTAVYQQIQPQGITAETVAAVKTAVSRYRGDFAADLLIGDAPEFESWLLLERERLQQMALDLWGAMVGFALAHGRFGEGIGHARRILALAPWREDTHRDLMRLLAANGQRAAALAQFDACRHALAEELGVEPAEETVALAASLKSDRSLEKVGVPSAPLPTIPSPRHNLPAVTTPFVGREEELAQIGNLLADPGCRLLTLIGPGGVGKTRLALEAARQVVTTPTGQFEDGVYFVSLTSVVQADDLMTAVGQGIGLAFSGSDEPEVQLRTFLKTKKMLLLLDNFEQIVAESPRLTGWLEGAPRLKLIVTSRQRLHLVEEWLLDLPGLPVPEADGRLPVEAYASVQLFAQRARRVHLGFDLAAEATAVADICRLTGGLPLALELAAAWVRAFACADIAREIQNNLDFLTTQARNRPRRHTSFRAVFEHSWTLLAPDERRVLSQLTLFRGGFRLASAQAITEATPRLLASLVDKSLVQRHPNGRYTLHTLLQQLAAEKLPPADVERLQMAHARYFVDLLAAETAVLRGPEPEAAAANLVPELDNIRLAWRTVCQQGDAAAIGAAVISLFELYDLHARYAEGEQLLVLAETAVADDLLLARIMALRARFLTRQGKLAASEALHRAALPILAERGERREYGDALNGLNNVLRRGGAYDEARMALEQAQQVYEEAGFQRGVASVLNNLGLAAFRQGDLETAVTLQQRSVDLYRKTGPRKDLATVLSNLGLSQLKLGRLDTAVTNLEESAQLAQEIGYHGCLVVAMQNLAEAAFQQKAFDVAESRLLDSLKLAREVGVQDMTGYILDDLSILYLELGRMADARLYGEEALDIGEQLGLRWLVASAQGNLAEVALAEGMWAEAERRLEAGLAEADAIEAESLRHKMLARKEALQSQRQDV